MKKSTTIRNIDSTHSKFIYEFEIDETEIIPKLMDEKEQLKKKISKLKGNAFFKCFLFFYRLKMNKM